MLPVATRYVRLYYVTIQRFSPDTNYSTRSGMFVKEQNPHAPRTKQNQRIPPNVYKSHNIGSLHRSALHELRQRSPVHAYIYIYIIRRSMKANLSLGQPEFLGLCLQDEAFHVRQLLQLVIAAAQAVGGQNAKQPLVHYQGSSLRTVL